MAPNLRIDSLERLHCEEREKFGLIISPFHLHVIDPVKMSMIDPGFERIQGKVSESSSSFLSSCSRTYTKTQTITNTTQERKRRKRREGQKEKEREREDLRHGAPGPVSALSGDGPSPATRYAVSKNPYCTP